MRQPKIFRTPRPLEPSTRFGALGAGAGPRHRRTGRAWPPPAPTDQAANARLCADRPAPPAESACVVRSGDDPGHRGGRPAADRRAGTGSSAREGPAEARGQQRQRYPAEPHPRPSGSWPRWSRRPVASPSWPIYDVPAFHGEGLRGYLKIEMRPSRRILRRARTMTTWS